MTEHMPETSILVSNIMASFREAGLPADESCIRRAVEHAIAQDTFRVGEEVTCHHGCITGYIVAIDGDVAQIAWSGRGRSTTPLTELDHLAAASQSSRST